MATVGIKGLINYMYTRQCGLEAWSLISSYTNVTIKDKK